MIRSICFYFLLCLFVNMNIYSQETSPNDWENETIFAINKEPGHVPYILGFSALHFTDQALWEAVHDFKLDEIRKPEVYLSLDCIQQGLGNASCGPKPLPEYMIPANQHLSYSFRITGIQ